MIVRIYIKIIVIFDFIEICGIIKATYLMSADVAQSVEQLIRNQQVRCSSHPISSKALSKFDRAFFVKPFYFIQML